MFNATVKNGDVEAAFMRCKRAAQCAGVDTGQWVLVQTGTEYEISTPRGTVGVGINGILGTNAAEAMFTLGGMAAAWELAPRR